MGERIVSLIGNLIASLILSSVFVQFDSFKRAFEESAYRLMAVVPAAIYSRLNACPLSMSKSIGGHSPATQSANGRSRLPAKNRRHFHLKWCAFLSLQRERLARLYFCSTKTNFVHLNNLSFRCHLHTFPIALPHTDSTVPPESIERIFI